MDDYVNDAKSMLIGLLTSSGVVFLTDSTHTNIWAATTMVLTGVMLLIITCVEHKRKKQ